MSFPYKNPISPSQLSGQQSLDRTKTYGTSYSTLSTGGYMEVYSLDQLYYTIPPSTFGPIEFSGNSIPITFSKGSGTTFSFDTLTLQPDNISSGRRKQGMLVYVKEVDQVYQYNIENYFNLFTAATASTGTVVISDFGTTVKSNSSAGIAFISGWTANTIDGVSGVTRANAVWKKYYGSNLSVTGATYSNNTITFTNNTGGTFNVLFNTFTGATINGNLSVTGLTSSTSFSGSSDTITGSKGSIITSGSSTTAFINVSGSNTVGGTGYTDFIRVTNTAAGATNINKTIRVNNTGRLEFLNSAYTFQTLNLSDNGILSVGGDNFAGTSSSDGVSNYLQFGNNTSQIYDDGNFHIHSKSASQSMWINTNGGQLNLLAQAPLAGGSIGSGIAIATTSLNGYVTINTGRTITTAVAYGFLTTAGAGTYPGGSQSVSISLYANNRIWGQEIDAFSDERMKDIQGEITLEEGVKLVNNLIPIKYTWKEGDDKGIKAGYSAQQVSKAGFDHLISLIPKEGLEETIDEDGFLSPKDTQFSMNYDQVVPYHGVVIKHLLEEIENLKKEIESLKNK
jgi:hypothetical protein